MAKGTKPIVGRTVRGLRRDSIPGGYVLGRQTGAPDGPAQLLAIASLLGSTSVQTLLNSISGVQGSILYRNATAWVALAPDTAGKVLQTNGAGANPSWAAAATGSLELTDGVTDLTGVAKITVSGLTVGGASPNATLTAAASGAAQFTDFPIPTSTTTAAFASKGNLITPHNNCSVVSAGGLLTTVTSATYKIGIAPYNTGTNQITSAPTYTPVYTESAGAAHTPFFLTFSSPVALTAGTTYIIFLVRTDSTTTVSQTIDFGSGALFRPGFYYATSGVAFRLASTGPTTSDTWTADGSGTYCIGFTYTIP